ATRQQRYVVRPRGRTDMHHRIRLSDPEQLGAEPEGATAPGRLDGAHPIRSQRGMALPQDEARHGLAIGRISDGRYGALGLLTAQDDLLCPTHAAKDGRFALFVTINAYTEVDLAGIRIRPELGHETENGVSRQALQTLEHRKSPSPRGKCAEEIDITSL